MGLGGTATAAYGTYYLATQQDSKELLKTWMEENKCSISVEISGTSTNTVNLKNNDSAEKDLVDGLWSWLNNETDTKKTTLGCTGGSEVNVTVTTSDKKSFSKKSS